MIPPWPIELAYIAGLWDGEGCFTIGYTKVKRRRKSPYWYAIASICMTDRRALDILHNIYGGRVYKHYNKGVKKDVYHWKLWSRKASAFADSIYEFLVIKKEAANLLILFQNHMDNFKGGGGKLLSEQEISFRNDLYKRMKGLNHRGKV